MPRIRGAVERFVRHVIAHPPPPRVVRTRALEALVIGTYVRGLSDHDIQCLAEEAMARFAPPEHGK